MANHDDANHMTTHAAALSRREFLKTSSALAGLALLSRSLPLAALTDSASPRGELTHFIYNRMAAGHFPGLAVGVIRDNHIVAAQGYGWANIAWNVPVAVYTNFMLASVSKTVTATAVMQLNESGVFALDDDVNGYLPFAVRNPNFPDEPITFRGLLTHTSGIRDNWTVLTEYYVQGDSPVPLGEFLADYLVPGGPLYFPRWNYYRYPPATTWNYSNIGVSLAAYLVEAMTGIPFDQYCDQNIFARLPMVETSWHLAGLNQGNVAMPYLYRFDTRDYLPYGHYGYPDYPDGGLRTSVKQLAHHLMAFMNDGTYNGVQMLRPETVAEMRVVQYPSIDPTQGLIWYYDDSSGYPLLGHDGGDYGVATTMFYRPEDGVGVIVLANGEGQPSSQPLYDIQDVLFELAGQINSVEDLDRLPIPETRRVRPPASRRRRDDRAR